MAQADTHEQTPGSVCSAFLALELASVCLSCPLPRPRKTTPYLGTILAWKEGAGGLRGRRMGREQPPVVPLALPWAGAHDGLSCCPPSPPHKCHSWTLPPLHFTLLLCLSKPPYEAMGMKGRTWVLCAVRETETRGLFSFCPGSSCHRHLPGRSRRGLKFKGQFSSPPQEGTAWALV